jgi:hypothetical protein
MDEFGCWRDAENADDIAAALTRIRLELDDTFSEDITDVINEILTSSQLLRDLYDSLRVYRDRVPRMGAYVSILMPCVRRTLVDVRYLIGTPRHTLQEIWCTIQSRMSTEAGVSLRTRFITYNNFLIQLVRLLSRKVQVLFRC